MSKRLSKSLSDMNTKKHFDELLRDWSFHPQMLGVRLVKGSDGRDVIQMRVDLGILQMETLGRPDGLRPEGMPDFLSVLLSAERDDDCFEMSEEQCFEADREFVQFYHRRISWLRLQQFYRAVADADHTLALMDVCRDHSPDEDWTMSHEQYRPFVLFHRTQAAALSALDDDQPAKAIEEISNGLESIRAVFEEHDAADAFDDDEMVARLRELSDKLRHDYSQEPTLEEKLDDAVKTEQYELAARLRDELAKRYDN